MIYMLPIGGFVPKDFGVMSTPAHKGVPASIIAGRSWCGDNQAYTKKFDLNRYLEWLYSMRPYARKCLFISVPDAVGNAKITLQNFDFYHRFISDWPLAFVAQDGQENYEFPAPHKWSTLFIGGTTNWKDSARAYECIKRADALGKHIHIGRVNGWKRYSLFAQIEKECCHAFTCDGTKNKYIGVKKAITQIRAYRGWINQGIYYAH